MDFLNRHWVAILAIVGGVAVNYVQWSYVSAKVNPDTIAAYQVTEAKRVMREEIRFCVFSEIVSPEPKTRAVLRCLE